MSLIFQASASAQKLTDSTAALRQEMQGDYKAKCNESSIKIKKDKITFYPDGKTPVFTISKTKWTKTYQITWLNASSFKIELIKVYGSYNGNRKRKCDPADFANETSTYEVKDRNSKQVILEELFPPPASDFALKMDSLYPPKENKCLTWSITK